MKGLKTVVAAIALCMVAPAAQAAFCEDYRQTSSTAGPCDDCKVRFVKTGERSYSVRANNGWRANVRWRDGTGIDLSGRGTWPQQNDAEFGIRFVSVGKTMQMRMTIVGGLDFTARFQCLD